jgi:hypothetical protein
MRYEICLGGREGEHGIAQHHGTRGDESARIIAPIFFISTPFPCYIQLDALTMIRYLNFIERTTVSGIASLTMDQEDGTSRGKTRARRGGGLPRHRYSYFYHYENEGRAHTMYYTIL